jgi:hypothetical protein
VLAVFFALALQLKARVRRTGASTGKLEHFSLRAGKRSNYPSRWQWVSLVVILSKPMLRAEGSERSARSVAMFATQESRVWIASF